MPFQNSSSRSRRHNLIVTGIMALLVILVVVVVLAAVLSPGREENTSSDVRQWSGNGTTKHLREIILGRCYNYITTVNPELKDKDCLNIWEELQHAFIYKHPCNMQEEDYQPLKNLASHSVPCSKSLFWSKTNDLVHRYTKANRDFFTLEDTLLGYIADRLTWCGSVTSPGIDYISCPEWKDCDSNPVTLFWKMASKMFAETACGTVQVMLNGSLEAGAFKNNSFFGGIEIFHLNPEKVSTMQIWLMNDVDGPQRDSCTGHSITTLTNILKSRKINATCENNYRPVQFLQCASYPDHSTCKFCS
ncbi:ADP-ribosyl cyclase/cyclic ADP-ribose hydrolase 1-like [Hemicordylus capensis]|uniref:ADP-ribosyl cyclase/cyclic ADP-ribose hydrolase 1-like n=1 Tax=Hemicordylus capensis TaxID=884348 RepID=UPI0023041A60|nr:ADP-ribosyl cyclase/cyclic ADP-ribose hydrolase 1-like [Hemicordylus capensis]